MITIKIPTSIKEVKDHFKEKQDKRYNHNKQVVRNMYNEIIAIIRANYKGFHETKEIKDCLIRGIKAID